MSFVALSLEQLLELHALAVNHSGGSSGVRDLGRLEAAVATQSQEVFGQELYGSAQEKAAAFMRGIVQDHPFIDGNKRTAMLAGLTLLEVNGLQFVAKKGEVEDFAVRIATDHLDVSAIAEWLVSHTSWAI